MNLANGAVVQFSSNVSGLPKTFPEPEPINLTQMLGLTVPIFPGTAAGKHSVFVFFVIFAIAFITCIVNASIFIG